MTKGLLTTVLFCIITLGILPTISAQDNHLEKQILDQNLELVIVVVATEGFSEQNQSGAKHYKEKYHDNMEWFKKNWNSFILSVDKEESYRVKIKAKQFAIFSDSQKSKINEMYNTSFTGRFDPVGVATSQIHGVIYNPKLNADKEMAYKKLQLRDEDVNTYIQNKNTAVLVIDSDTANEIGSILSH